MRLIDADELWKQMKELYEQRAEEANMTGDRVVCVTWHDAVVFIKNAPAVDAVEVVRCIECRYYETTTCPVSYMRIASRGRFKTFCSWGEKKEDGETKTDRNGFVK